MNSDDKEQESAGKADIVGSNSADWMNKLEAASGEKVRITGVPRNSSTGAFPGQRTLQFTCAETGNRFSVSFTRHSPSHRFQIASVVKESTKSSVAFQKQLLKHQNRSEQSFDASEFDWTGWFCPHCGQKETFIHCDKCGELVCGRRVRKLQDGTEVFACCDGCGETGEISGYIESYKGSQDKSGDKPSRLLFSHSPREQLPPPRN